MSEHIKWYSTDIILRCQLCDCGASYLCYLCVITCSLHFSSFECLITKIISWCAGEIKDKTCSFVNSLNTFLFLFHSWSKIPWQLDIWCHTGHNSGDQFRAIMALLFTPCLMNSCAFFEIGCPEKQKNQMNGCNYKRFLLFVITTGFFLSILI